MEKVILLYNFKFLDVIKLLMQITQQNQKLHLICYLL